MAVLASCSLKRGGLKASFHCIIIRSRTPSGARFPTGPQQPQTASDRINAAQPAISALTTVSLWGNIVTLIFMFLAWQHQCKRDTSSARAQRPRLEPLHAAVAGRWGLISSIRQSLRTALVANSRIVLHTSVR